MGTAVSVPAGPIDADNHYYEPRDFCTRHIEPRFRAQAVRVDEEERVWVGDRPFTFLKGWNFDLYGRPGALRELLRKKRYDEYGESATTPALPEYRDRDARLARMDQQGLEAAFLFPTVGVCLEHFMKDRPDQLYANLRAFNAWLDEDWGFAYRDRIYAAPMLSLLDVDRAVQELERVLGRGARILSLRPAPVAGRSPADPHFDPFWARVNEARVCVAFHIGESGYNELMSVHWGEEPNPSSHEQSAFQWTNFYGDRPIMDTLSSMIFYNLFGRFPDVKVASVENGSLFVPYLMRVMDKMGGMGRNGPWPGGRIREKPSAIFRRHVFVSPYHEEDVVALAREIGAPQVLFGSDYPHPEGLANPLDFRSLIQALEPDDQALILRENAARLLGRSRRS
jgi:predicted TIM-barrel fold metal-dependent hydrolase